MESKTYKLDIFEVLNKISNSDIKYWNSLEEEQQKAFVPLVIMRWLSSNTPYEIIFLNTILNRYVFELGKHKGLLYNLMSICTIPNSKYTWIKRGAKDVKFPKSTKILAEYLNYSIRETKDILQFYTNDDIIEICNEMGFQKDTISDLKKELKKRNV